MKKLEETMAKRVQELEQALVKSKSQLDEVQTDKERLVEEKIKQDNINDQSMTNIVTLQATLKKKETELQNFQVVIGNLNESVMEKERECQRLANKLSQMKQMLIDNEQELSMQKSFGAVKIGSFSKTACTVSPCPLFTPVDWIPSRDRQESALVLFAN